MAEADGIGEDLHSAPPVAAVGIDADADVVAGREPPSAVTPLSRQRVVDAAVAYIDDSGLAALTMRRLGARLGVEAMALYRYVPGKEDLLDAVVDTVMDLLDKDDDVAGEPSGGWQDFLQRLAHGMRRVALTHPNAFPLVVSRPPAAPWLRPPLRSLRLVETMIEALLEEGFDDRTSVAAYRAFSNFLLGHLLLEVSTLGADVGPLDVAPDPEDSAERLEGFPTLRRLHPELRQNHAAAEFEVALEELLNRLAQMRSEQGSDEQG